MSRPSTVPVSREELARLRQADADLKRVMAARASLEGTKTEMMTKRRQAREAGMSNAFAEGWLACFNEDWASALEHAAPSVDDELPF